MCTQFWVEDVLGVSKSKKSFCKNLNVNYNLVKLLFKIFFYFYIIKLHIKLIKYSDVLQILAIFRYNSKRISRKD